MRLLDAAAARLRAAGPDGTAVAEVMSDAGLTHGGFYGHFQGKDALVDAAFHHAMTVSRTAFFQGLEDAHGEERLRWLAGRYLGTRHRDRPEDGCALASLAGDAAREGSALGPRFEAEFLRSLARVSENETTDGEVTDSAIAFFALMIGGLLTARAVDDPTFSDRILRACRQLAPRLAKADHAPSERNDTTRTGAQQEDDTHEP